MPLLYHGVTVIPLHALHAYCLQPILVAYINEAADGLDFRFKKVAQYHIKKDVAGGGDTAACWEYAEACSWDPVQQVRTTWPTRTSGGHA